MTSLEKIRLSAQTWDSDKNPNGFPKFCQDLSALVRCLKYGPPLEEFLDETLDRNSFQQVTTPSFILDNPYLREDYIPPELKEYLRDQNATDLDAPIYDAICLTQDELDLWTPGLGLVIK